LNVSGKFGTTSLLEFMLLGNNASMHSKGEESRERSGSG
jgi:hypothetical protein